MKAVVWYCAVLFICAVSANIKDAATCADAPVIGLALESVEEVVKDLFFKGEAVGTLTVLVQPKQEPLCVRMIFEAADPFSLVSIRGGIFTKKELIPEPVKYRNRRNAVKVVTKRGEPAGTLLNRLSLVICQDEMVADEMGCCENSSLFWVGHAILRGAGGEEFRAEVTADGTCELRVANGPDIPVCELPVACGCDPIAFCLLETANEPVCIRKDDYPAMGNCLGNVVFADPETRVCTCGCPGAEPNCLIGGECIKLADTCQAAEVRNGSCTCIIRGTAEGEFIRGSDGPDLIYGYGGRDIIYGLGGDDEIFAGAGDDVVYGGLGNDSMFGGYGSDFINGQAGDDLIKGEDGNDALVGGSGNDAIYGGDGDDTISSGAGSDVLDGGPGSDVIDNIYVG
ncbi:hypothetical protein NDN08_001934 [Rhodosorus marinus]|uniref:Calcium-binding protein n=1 Tax=Rhodosorus marinus TaxID=101924 RepID=A0AAV8UWL8_9RHOD|nr:hypothetical protein NDN08_001934 [Rhodosorus marinus]